MQSNVYLQAKPVDWLTLRTQYGIDYVLSDNDIFYTPIHGPGQGLNGEAIAAFRKRKNWVWTNTAQFDYTFASDHNVSFLVGNEQQRRTVSGYGIDRTILLDPAFTNVQSGFSTNNSSSTILSENYLLSSFGRLNYNFKKKYFLSGNLRQDEYSALGIKKGTFWGASAGWEITQEGFWQTTGLNNVFSSFKIRGSYGKVGNISGIGDYDYYSTFSSGLYGGTGTLSFSNAGDPNLTWETSKKTDVGFSFGVLKERLTGEFAYFKNDINGLILAVPQAPSAGIPNSIFTNVGSMYNKGVELTLNASIVQTKGFSWSSNFNASYIKNQVTSLGSGLTEVLYLTGSGSTGENVNRTVPGYSVGYLWVVRTGGVDPNTGRRIFYNKAGQAVTYQHIVPAGGRNWSYLGKDTATPAITQSADAVMYKPTQPKYVGGWSNTFRYKGLELNVLMTYQAGGYISYGTNAGLHDQRFWNNTTDVLQRWQKPGDITNYPRAIFNDNVSYGNTIPLDINVFKSDFIKLKTATLSYMLPKAVSDKIKLSTARVYVSGQNLLMWTDYPGSDPEVSSNGTSSAGQGSERNSVVNGRTITVGLQVSF
jgi:TonB-linked SusC/RagA family outer membrane protein